MPLARTATPLCAPGRAARPRTRLHAVALIAAVVALWLAAIPIATSASATSGSAKSHSTAVERQPRLMAAGDALGTPLVTALISVRGTSYGV